jgi:hypothetical protein
MASSPEMKEKGVNEPVAAKDGMNEKDPATALGEWYVQYLSMRSLVMMMMSKSWDTEQKKAPVNS